MPISRLAAEEDELDAEGKGMLDLELTPNDIVAAASDSMQALVEEADRPGAAHRVVQGRHRCVRRADARPLDHALPRSGRPVRRRRRAGRSLFCVPARRDPAPPAVRLVVSPFGRAACKTWPSTT